jgi:hypothetical protein
MKIRLEGRINVLIGISPPTASHRAGRQGGEAPMNLRRPLIVEMRVSATRRKLKAFDEVIQRVCTAPQKEKKCI